MQYKTLVDDFKKIGLKKGMVVMVHSSFKSLNFNEGTPEIVIKALKEVLTEEGTLLMPTLTYKTVSKDNPYFSLMDTKSDVGVITEVFRKMPQTHRSINPIHSVSAWGKYAIELTKHHIKDSVTIGNNSPFKLMLKYDAKILMLGTGLKPNTFMHLVENENKLSYRIIKRKFEVIITNLKGEKFNTFVELPDMSGFNQRYDRIEKILDKNEIRQEKILSADSYLIDANLLFLKASNKLKDDKFYFVDKLE